MRVLLSLILLTTLSQALPFSLVKHEGATGNGPTLFVIGGIHGNEPGSYFAASILAQYYTITKGNLWVIPNLNHKSIMMNSRGINGDMNRKFADIDENDKDYLIVDELKKIITVKGYLIYNACLPPCSWIENMIFVLFAVISMPIM